MGRWGEAMGGGAVEGWHYRGGEGMAMRHGETTRGRRNAYGPVIHIPGTG